MVNNSSKPKTGLELRSELLPEGRLDLSLKEVEIGEPAPGEIIVQVQAAPINPSDMGLMLGAANPSEATVTGEGMDRTLVMPLQPPFVAAMAKRHNLSICPGLEGAGIVVAAGQGCEQLIGKTAAMFGGEMYAQYRKIRPADCIIFPEGISPGKCASVFVNPLTALGMINTLRQEKHKALIHTAAASNLGQMLVKLCKEEDIPLINVVRRREQVEILRALGAEHVLDSSADGFEDSLTALIRKTDATLAFDAIGGGNMATTILGCMEQVYAPEDFYIYGSQVRKQIYVYGVLNPGPIEILRNAGMAWSVSGWLMMNHLASLEAEAVQAMKDRVVDRLDTVFASNFTDELSLGDMLDVEKLEAMSLRSTGEKYMLNPSK